MKVTVKQKCKPNGANEFGLGKEWALESTQVIELPDTFTPELLEYLAKCLAVDVQNHVRASLGNVEKREGKQVNSRPSLENWRANVAKWDGREMPFAAAIASPITNATKAYTDALAVLIGIGMTQAQAEKALREKLGLTAPTA